MSDKTENVKDKHITVRKPRRDPTKSNGSGECIATNTYTDITSIPEIDTDALNDAPAWGKVVIHLLNCSMKSLNEKIIGTCELLTTYTDRLETVSSDASSAITIAKQNASDISTLSNKIDELSAALSKSNTETDKLKEHILKNESYSRRENLVFRGFEDSNLPCDQIVRNIIGKMNITGLNHTEVQFVRCHYLDRSKLQIIVRFLSFSDRELIWRHRRFLKTNAANVYVSEDYPAEIERRRKELYPIAAAANKIDDFRRKVKITGDRLIVNNQSYNHTTLHNLPTTLQPMRLS